MEQRLLGDAVFCAARHRDRRSSAMVARSGDTLQDAAGPAGGKRFGAGGSAEEDAARTSTPETPLSGKFKLAVFVIALCESTQINSLFAFAAFMVEDLVPGLPEEDVGYYAGVLAASFQAAQCCTSVAWGRASDKVGRKPALLVGLVGSIAALLVVGFAPSYGIAVLGRVLAGGLNGNISATPPWCTAPAPEPTAPSAPRSGAEGLRRRGHGALFAGGPRRPPPLTQPPPRRTSRTAPAASPSCPSPGARAPSLDPSSVASSRAPPSTGPAFPSSVTGPMRCPV